MTTVYVMKLFPNHASKVPMHSLHTLLPPLSTLQHRNCTMLGIVRTHIFLVIELSLLF